MIRSLIGLGFTGACLGVLSANACPPKCNESSGSATPPEPVLLGVLPSEPAPPSAVVAQRAVDLAICLDTSGSMNGLIEAAKTKLWEIVNDLALAKPAPKLRVALLTYGNDGHNAENGWVQIDSPLTGDLDLISQKLFALTTNGGTELVGRVVKAANEQLQWTPSADALKLIVVAGNESADQDQQFSYRDVCKATITKGIMVNSIYCGNIADDIAPGWKEVSTLADGKFACIDQNNGTVIISTPFDGELVMLSGSINTTYIPYGEKGKVASANQVAQDANAASVGQAVAAQRCATKGCGTVYWNSQWDLVDACKDKTVKLEDVKAEDLPENMRAMSVEQRKEYVAEMEKKRADLQAKVAELNKQRQQFVDEEMKKNNASNDKSFDTAMRKAIREQAASKGFKFDDGC